MKYGKAIKNLRKQLSPNITQYNFAEKIGITAIHLSNIERGKVPPSIRLLDKISEYYNIPVAVIMWLGTTEDDFKKEKQKENFKIISPAIVALLKSLY